MTTSGAASFHPWLDRWSLVPDGAPIVTGWSRLLPVRRDGEPLMLKLAQAEDEQRGGALMAWWDGDGAARVHAHAAGAVLMERATGSGSLAHMARTGRDDEAARVLCAVAARLHAPRAGTVEGTVEGTVPGLVPLDRWFGDLWPAAQDQGGVLARAAAAARTLLAEPRDPVVLHGDIHHANVLDFGPRGWLAIDPKGLWGERGYDFGNIFLNPDLDDPSCSLATDPTRFARRVDLVAGAAGLDRRRLLGWVLARAGLTAAWYVGESDERVAVCLKVAALAAAGIEG